ncbi:hypothetical protein SKA34_06550 [Photobacterium sp. SKA34]|nr:hypothetical protein SKA34_06550 [Photobacterium sp. SKA34]
MCGLGESLTVKIRITAPIISGELMDEWLIEDTLGIHTVKVKGNFTTNNASALRGAIRTRLGLHSQSISRSRSEKR